MNDTIRIKGARENNLKNVDLTIPRDKLVVFTGLSGSGKSSLAFDTIYAEGQRRYVESLSSYARQFLGQMDKPDVDSIDGLSPAISIDQKTTSKNPRSTVGTVTEIYDYLRLLWARVEYNMERYISTFFALLKDAQFRDKVAASKGFCLRHFARLLQECEIQLPESQRQWFQDTVLPLMKDNMVRVKEDLDWLIAKHDYRNASKPWGNSQDSLPRAMQKLQGIHPADGPFREK